VKSWKKTTNKTETKKIVTIIRKTTETIRKIRTIISADTDCWARSIILAQNKEWPGKYIYSKPFFVLRMKIPSSRQILFCTSPD